MKCTECGHESSRVLDTRIVANSIRRRRECENCLNRFTTFERRGLFESMVIKKDNTKETYQRDKVRKAITIACTKRDISNEDIERAIDTLEIHRSNEIELYSYMIGNDILKFLKSTDDVAYIRFASVYQNFDTVQDFLDSIQSSQ